MDGQEQKKAKEPEEGQEREVLHECLLAKRNQIPSYLDYQVKPCLSISVAVNYE